MNRMKRGLEDIVNNCEFYRWDRANSALVFNTVSGAVDDDSTGRHAA